MNPLEDHNHLVELFSNVTTSMLSMDCILDSDVPGELGTFHTSAVVPIPGEGGFSLAITSDMAGCVALSSAMFAVEHAEVDAEMIEDTLAELANMAAGQLKGLLQLNNSLGLPVAISSASFSNQSVPGDWKHYAMLAGEAKVLLSITTVASIAEEYMRS